MITSDFRINNLYFFYVINLKIPLWRSSFYGAVSRYFWSAAIMPTTRWRPESYPKLVSWLATHNDSPHVEEGFNWSSTACEKGRVTHLHCNPLQGHYRVEVVHSEIPVVITGNGFAEYNFFLFWLHYFPVLWTLFPFFIYRVFPIFPKFYVVVFQRAGKSLL